MDAGVDKKSHGMTSVSAKYLTHADRSDIIDLLVSGLLQYFLRFGVVLVSTGAPKAEQPSVVRIHVKSRKLNINANDNLAIAA